jgi:hypothetical protein
VIQIPLYDDTKIGDKSSFLPADLFSEVLSLSSINAKLADGVFYASTVDCESILCNACQEPAF